MSEEMMPSTTQNAGSKTNLLIVAAIILLLIGGAVVFSRNQDTKMNGTMDTQQTEMEVGASPAVSDMVDEDANLIDGGMALDGSSPSGDPAVSDMADGEVRTIQVEAGAFYYKPASITVKKGEKVKIVMTSKDMMHDFVVDELGIKSPVTKAGETATFEFTATETGTYEYYCSVGQHKANGQVGTLIVQ